MSDEERNDLPPGSTPDTGAGAEPLEDAPGRLENTEDRLGEQLGDTADSVTRELRDLQDELIPPTETPAATYVEPDVDAFAGTSEPAGEMPGFEPGPAVPPTTPPVASYLGPSASLKSGSPFVPEGNDDDRLISMLAWLSMAIFQIPVVSLIQLFSENTKNRPFQRHHAITSLLFWVAALAYEAIATVVFTILTIVTLGCGAACLWVIFFVPHVLALYYALQAYNGKRVEVPYLSRFARQQGWL